MKGFFWDTWRKNAVLLLCCGVFAGAGQLAAETPGMVVTFGDGLKLAIPAEWNVSTLNTAAAPAKKRPSSQGDEPLTLLARAEPGDSKRTASLTVLRDARVADKVAGVPTQEMQTRLVEIALLKGYSSEQSTQKGQGTGLNNAILVEIDGVNRAGEHRLFKCVELNRASLPTLRCYWEHDQTDPAAQREFENWLASLVLKDIRVADVLAGSTSLVADNTSRSANLPSPSNPGGTTMTEATPAGSNSKETGELVTKNRSSLMVVQGDKATGSGFVCTLDGEPWLLTNAHVLSDNPRPKFIALGGAVAKPGPALLAVGSDICKIKMPVGTPALEAMQEMDSTAKIGDAIVVVGNAEGAGVVHPFEGRIVGIGPNLVEVDAPFVPGNSGSPIIHVPSGKVIGIATYLIVRKVDGKGEGTIQTLVRRFGYRVDNVKNWEAVNWPAFYSQSAQVAQIEANGEEFEKLFADARAKTLFSSKYRNPGIQRALDGFAARVKGGKVSEADLTFARRELQSNLRTTSLLDVKAFDSRQAYDYFRRAVATEMKFRDEIYEGFTRSLNSAGP